MKNAALKQGKSEKRREPNRAMIAFSKPNLTKPSILDNYRNDVEIFKQTKITFAQNFQLG